jgi:O-succinylbenzoic acid--CoA ligase
MINLNFSNITTEEALLILQPFNEKWIEKYYHFLSTYCSSQKIQIRTSGTTGNPKTITVSRDQMQKSAGATLNYFNLKKGDSCLLALSCEFIAGKMMLVRAIEGKLNLFLGKPCSDPSHYFSQKYDFVPLVPMQVQNIIKSEEIGQIRQLLVGGGKVSNEIISQIKVFQTKVFESFGMSETLTHFAIKQISPNYSEWFKTIAGFEIDTNKKDELVIKKNGIINSTLKTKDLIEKKSNSEFKWLGRSDNIINSGGIKIIPEEIERKIAKLISVRFVLIGLPDNQLGQKIAIVSEKPLKIELEKINKDLSQYEKIKISKIVTKFPITESGKIKRKELQIILNV